MVRNTFEAVNGGQPRPIIQEGLGTRRFLSEGTEANQVADQVNRQLTQQFEKGKTPNRQSTSSSLKGVTAAQV